MATPQQDQPLATFEGGTLLQPYMPGPGYLEPQHAGVDVGLPAFAPVYLPQGGTYDLARSSPYQSVFDLAGGGYEELLHLTNPIKYPAGAPVAAGTPVGFVAPGTASGLYNESYGWQQLGPFTSTGPHVHIAEYLPGYGQQAEYSQTEGSIDPTALLSPGEAQAAQQGANPIATAAGALGTAAGQVAGAVGSGVEKAVGTALNPAQAATDALTSALGKLIPPNLLQNAGALLVGALLVAGGAFLLVQVGRSEVVKTALGRGGG